MNSKGWKVSLFAIAAVVGLSACGDKKKTRATTPYAGIWVNQQNIREFSMYRSRLNAGEYNGFCRIVYDNRGRFGDSQFRVRAIIVQPNGDVLRYSASENVTELGFREGNFLGTVTMAGQFTAGAIGPDGRISPNGYGYGSSEMPARSVFSLSPSNPNLMRYWGQNGSPEVAERHPRAVVDEYALHVSMCLGELRKLCVKNPNHRRCVDQDLYPDQPGRPLPPSDDAALEK